VLNSITLSLFMVYSWSDIFVAFSRIRVFSPYFSYTRVNHNPGTGERCYDPSVCRSRRSHARKSDQNNYNRRLQHQKKKQQSQRSDFAATILNSSIALLSDESDPGDGAVVNSPIAQSIHPPLSVPLHKGITQRYYAILLLYREPRYRGRVHALRAQVWQGSDLINEVDGEHCIGMTPGDVIHYVEAMLALLKEVYDIPYFADIEQLDPDYCPIRPCPRHSARFIQLQP
ncbi:hypothetical protein IQ250_24075, partial [Pseudanabaenaceae cyanobacterium LEGE 13415]|nr:hypothetical protein [Pseudanabaenaceae cyanobacterium LEGE 13415]